MYYASDNKCVENRYKDNAKPYVLILAECGFAICATALFTMLAVYYLSTCV